MRPDHNHTYTLLHDPHSSVHQQALFRPILALRYEEVEPQIKGPHQLGATKKEKKVVSSSAVPNTPRHLPRNQSDSTS